MTAQGGDADDPRAPADLTELSVTQLLAEITKDHTVATKAGKTQGESLKAMGRKVAEVRTRTGISWRKLAAESGVPVRTMRRYAEPFLPPKD